MFQKFLAFVLVLAVGSPVMSGEFKSLAAGIIGMSRKTEVDTPVTPPSPSPKPVSADCDNCNGVGKVGDGRTMLTCPVCNGTGKKASDAPLDVKVFPNYPIRNSWWTGCSGWRHLTLGQHAGKFDSEWLLGLSNAEIQSLHSDDHEGKVKWDFVVPGKGATKSKDSTQFGGCPGGVCPPRGMGIFRLFR